MNFYHSDMMSRCNKVFLFFVCVCLQLIFCQNCYGDNREESIKVAYLYNFAKFSYWKDFPEDAPLHIQIVGTHPFGESVRVIASKKVAGHAIEILVLPQVNPERTLHILFISTSHAAKLPSVLAAVAGKEVLTISDIVGFADKGGMIELVEKENNIQFRINLDAAKKAGVELSSQMLRLANSVINNSK